MRIVGVDPSGNWKEGRGTTGIAVLEDDEVRLLAEIRGADYDSPEAYWKAVLDRLGELKPDQIVCEAYVLYRHESQAQVWSEMETPQLIGVLRMWAYVRGIPVHFQKASEVKNRWSDTVLVRKGYLIERNGKYYWKDLLTNAHKRDALRHALHFQRYKR